MSPTRAASRLARGLWLAALVGCWSACCCSRASGLDRRQDTVDTNDGSQTTDYHMVIVLSLRGPALPPRGGRIEVWWRGTRFRVRDDTGRPVYAMLADLAAPRGLGSPPDSIEEMMDLAAAARKPKPPPIELFGDTAGGDGWVHEPGRDPWPMDAARLAALASQMRVDKARPATLEVVGHEARAGRQATVLKGELTGTVHGAAFTSRIRRVVAAPYLLLDDVRDAVVGDYACTREVTLLEEGGVSEADVQPPR